MSGQATTAKRRWARQQTGASPTPACHASPWPLAGHAPKGLRLQLPTPQVPPRPAVCSKGCRIISPYPPDRTAHRPHRRAQDPRPPRTAHRASTVRAGALARTVRLRLSRRPSPRRARHPLPLPAPLPQPARASRSARLQRARTTAPASLKRLTSPTREPEPSSGGRLTDAPAAANLPCALDDGRLQRKSSAWSSYPPSSPSLVSPRPRAHSTCRACSRSPPTHISPQNTRGRVT
ncbi:MAG: hypothetical protein RLZZ377_469 [Chloroflexota bacterium]